MCQVRTGAYVRPTTRAWKNRLYHLPPKKDFHVYIARSTYHYAYARQTQVNRKIDTKERKENNAKTKTERKEKEEQEKQEHPTRGSKERKREKMQYYY